MALRRSYRGGRWFESTAAHRLGPGPLIDGFVVLQATIESDTFESVSRCKNLPITSTQRCVMGIAWRAAESGASLVG